MYKYIPFGTFTPFVEIHYIAAPQHASFYLSHRQFLVLSFSHFQPLSVALFRVLHRSYFFFVVKLRFFMQLPRCLIFPTILIVQPADWKSSENSNVEKKHPKTSLLHSYNTLARLLIRILPPFSLSLSLMFMFGHCNFISSSVQLEIGGIFYNMCAYVFIYTYFRHKSQLEFISLRHLLAVYMDFLRKMPVAFNLI